LPGFRTTYGETLPVFRLGGGGIFRTRFSFRFYILFLLLIKFSTKYKKNYKIQKIKKIVCDYRAMFCLSNLLQMAESSTAGAKRRRGPAPHPRAPDQEPIPVPQHRPRPPRIIRYSAVEALPNLDEPPTPLDERVLSAVAVSGRHTGGRGVREDLGYGAVVVAHVRLGGYGSAW
jgi:hypothetical protein